MNYLIHSTIIISLLTILYRLLLAKETFFQLNRFVLLCILIVSVSLPLLTIPENWSLNQQLISTEHITIEFVLSNISDNQLGFSFYLQAIYWTGFSVFCLFFIIQLLSLFILKNRNQCYKKYTYNIVHLNSEKSPFSFFNWIFINPKLYDKETLEHILTHEKVHIKQLHSFDKILFECVFIVFWFNPLLLLLRKCINENLEYIVDKEVLKNTRNTQYYQLSLVKVAVNEQELNLVNSYNQSGLKTRILMMNAKSSSLIMSWKYLTIIPFLLFSVISMNATYSNDIYESDLGISGSRIDNIRYFKSKLIEKLKQDKFIRGANPAFTIIMHEDTLSIRNRNNEQQLPQIYSAFFKSYGIKHTLGKVIQNNTHGTNFGIGSRKDNELIGQWIL